MTRDSTSTFKLALISMPWSLFNRPSIQLGSLKAFLETRMQCQVDSFHPYLNIAEAVTIDTYRTISSNSWAGEALFSPLLFPEQKNRARKLFNAELSKKGQSIPDYNNLVSIIEKTCSAWIESFEIDEYDLIGFSVCFSQLLPSLYMTKRLKSIRKELPVVFGGSSCSGSIGKSLLHHFPEIDYTVDGEGENALLSLCRFLKDQKTAQSSKAKRKAPRITKSVEIADISELPYPDYMPYFQEISRIFPKTPFIPTLPLEFSRGCWWNKCTFCNLNLQWHKYRFKEAQRVVEETAHFVQQYQCLNFTFTDNALPIKQADNYFKTLSDQQLDLIFFAEIRAIHQPERLKLYRRGGLSTVQIGIESLSNSLLQKMMKGTTAIDNMAVMKLCIENSIQVEGNLITEFPTTTEVEIKETLLNLEFVLPYHPLKPAAFFLGYGSPIHCNYKNFAISSTGVHHKTKKLFPRQHLNSLEQLVTGYRGDRTVQRQLWKPVYQKIAEWQNFHNLRTDRKTAPLQYRDGGTFLIIRQVKKSGQPLQHRLKGLSRRIYLFCHTPQTISDILENFKGLKKGTLIAFIAELYDKRLMFRDNNKVLSLAIRQNL